MDEHERRILEALLLVKTCEILIFFVLLALGFAVALLLLIYG